MQNFLNKEGDTSKDGSSFLEEGDSSHKFLSFGSIPDPSDEVEDDSSNATHRESISKIIKDPIRTRLLSHSHDFFA